jgi:hypothetical protein
LIEVEGSENQFSSCDVLLPKFSMFCTAESEQPGTEINYFQKHQDNSETSYD